MTGIVGGPRAYDGPGLGEGPWKCPACAVENVGPLSAGCVSCGSGSQPPRHIGHQLLPVRSPADDLHLGRIEEVPEARSAPGFFVQADAVAAAGLAGHHEVFADLQPSVGFEQWWTINQPTLDRLPPKEIARLAWECSAIAHTARTMAAPPVTTDTLALAPEGKARRTIIAALELFKDQVLREAREEIATGEWLTIEETQALIQQLRTEGEERAV